MAAFLDRETVKIDALVAQKERLIALLQEKRAALITRAVTKGLDSSVPLKESGVLWLGDIPAHWEVRQLKHAATVLDCKHRTVPFVPNGFPVASIREVQSWEVDLTQAKMTTEEDYHLMIEGGRDPRPGDMIVSRNATVGAAALVPAYSQFCMGQDVSLVRPNAMLEAVYLNWLFRSDAITNQISSTLIGSTFFRINVEQIKELILPLPPVKEQQKIAANISTESGKLDALSSATERSIIQLTEMRAALISAAVAGKIDVREETA
jgi:type I restriction enzyme S subunit